VRHRFYKFFVRDIKGFLLNDGGVLKKENAYGILINMTVEDILIPKRNFGFVEILFIDGKEIKDIFKTSTRYKKNATREFRKFYKKRLYKTLAEYDKL